MRIISRSSDDDEKRWPAYVLGGRVRTSTIALIVAFFFTAWLYETYAPPPAPPPVNQTVPPGFVPDPDYTWVPRTQVQERPRTTYPTTTTPTTTEVPEPTTTTTSPTTSTPTTTPTGPPGLEDTPTTSPGAPPTTTVFDPDGPGGLLPPITLPVLPPPAPAAGATPPPPAPSAN
ncbi:hypothetical protein ACWDUN_00375 [Mycobacterium sp. NPDC003323]